MKVSDLITIARREADDTVSSPYLWSDPEWIEFAADAEYEAARRARLLKDSTTSAICQISVTAGNPVVALDSRVLFVRRATVAGVPLRSIDHRDLDEQVPDWESLSGTPQAFIRNWDTGTIRLYRAPDADLTLKLRVVRLPLNRIASKDQTPEINPRFHNALVHWMLYRAYSKKDTQTQDDQRAATHLALFEQEFGPKSSAIEENWLADNIGDDNHQGEL